jgi:hypothetical protein
MLSLLVPKLVLLVVVWSTGQPFTVTSSDYLHTYRSTPPRIETST